MSVYTNTGSDLSSTNKPSAFLESVRLLNEAEITRNSANPGVAPKNFVSMSASFDSKTFEIAISLPFVSTIDAAGKVVIDVTDYLGTTYSTFDPGTGTAKSTDLPSLTYELATTLQAAEKLIDVNDRPNNIQVTLDEDAGNITISATIPFTASIGALGVVTLAALDYL